MDIFVIEIKNNEDYELLKKFQKKEISNHEKWVSHCFSYMVVDKILEQVYKLEDRKVIFSNNKPILESGKKHFSISHSGKYTAIAFSDFNCGIDIEEIKPLEFEKISVRMRFECNTLEDFYKSWTKYEADYKLSYPVKINKYYTIENYALTVSSENSEEEFNLNIGI